MKTKGGKCGGDTENRDKNIERVLQYVAPVNTSARDSREVAVDNNKLKTVLWTIKILTCFGMTQNLKLGNLVHKH